MREEHLIDPITNYNPDVPEEGDTVRVYVSAEGETYSDFYLVGVVIGWTDNTEEYRVAYHNRQGNYRNITAKWDRVETEQVRQKK